MPTRSYRLRKWGVETIQRGANALRCIAVHGFQNETLHTNLQGLAYHLLHGGANCLARKHVVIHNQDVHRLSRCRVMP